MASKLDEFKIQAWQCPFCSDLVVAGFRQHYAACKKSHDQHIKRENERLAREEFLNAPRLYSTSPEDFIRRINCGLFGLYGLTVSLRVVDIVYAERVSNTHKCPVGGTTNWGLDKSLPTGYPGYLARYSFDERTLEKYHDKHRGDKDRRFILWYTDYITQFAGFHFGGGSIQYARGELFIDDFPKWDKTPCAYGKDRGW